MCDSFFDVITVGNAIVDIIAHVEDVFLATHNLHKGAMQLINAEEADRLYNQMVPSAECSGGSAANTAVGIAGLGGRAAYIGKLADDHLGQAFTKDINAAGVHFETRPLRGDSATARCLVLITPDAQRTMSTYMGACVALEPNDINPDLVRSARITYLEGYQWDAPKARDAMREAAEIAHTAGRQVALSLSDPFCVNRHRTEFHDLMHHHINILFANEMEIMSFYQVSTFSDALQAVRMHSTMAVLTRSERGAVIATTNAVHTTNAEPVAGVVDTTGAGDLFAAGFLYGLVRNHPPALCAQIGSLCAAEIVSHFGARPERSLADLVKARLPELRP